MGNSTRDPRGGIDFTHGPQPQQKVLGESLGTDKASMPLLRCIHINVLNYIVLIIF